MFSFAGAARVLLKALPGARAVRSLFVRDRDGTVAYLDEVQAVAAATAAHVGFGGSVHAAATTSVAGFMAAADKTKLDGLANYSLPMAAAGTLGGVKVGAGLAIDGAGVLSATGGASSVAEFWGRISDSAALAITAATTATIDRFHYITGTSSGYDITLPAAAANAGKVVGFVVKDWSVANKEYRLDAGSGVKIAGRSQFLTLIHTNVAMLISDGTDWQPLVLCLDTPWIDGGNFTITASTTNPTMGTNTRNQFWRRVGDSCEQWNKYTQTVAGSSGTGEYLIPTVFTVRSGTPTNTAASVNSSGDSIIGHGGCGYNTTQFATADVHLYSTSQFRVSLINEANRAWFGSGQAPLSFTSVLFTTQVKYPVQNW